MYLFENVLRAEDKDTLAPILMSVDHENSAECFTSLYMWRDIHDFCWQIIEGYLCVEGHFRPRQDEECLVHYMFPPLPVSGRYDAESLRSAVAASKEIFESKGEKIMIKRLTGKLKEIFEEAFPSADFEADRTFFDYVYSIEDLAELRGKKFHGQKNHVNRFLRENEEYEYREFTSDMREEALAFVDRINAARNDTAEDKAALEYERKAMTDVFARVQELGYMGGAIYIDGRMQALALGGRISDDMVSEHIEKANTEYNGLYPVMCRDFCRHMRSLGFTYVNREEDMGSPGLRRSKESYHPIRMVDKYIVTGL